MFSKIIVPLDGTPQSNAALPLARTLARATDAVVTVLRGFPKEQQTPKLSFRSSASRASWRAPN
jgi:nucleotide-binding universal stress UspA family protein